MGRGTTRARLLAGRTALGAALGLSLVNAFLWDSANWLSWVTAVLLLVAVGSLTRSGAH